MKSRPSPWKPPLALALLWLAFAYAWVLPLLRPRGYYLWGLQIRDLYLGIPIALVTLCATAIALWPRKSRRAFALRAVTVTFALGMALFAADAMYALGYGQAWKASPWFDERPYPRKYNNLHPELGIIKKPRSEWRGTVPWTGRPVVWRTDENGFRNPLNLRKADVVFLGDSYTEAMQVPDEETFVNQVSRALGVTAVNLGMGGYGPQQQLITLKRFGLGYQPKVVVWQVFEGNDLEDAEFFNRWLNGPRWPTRPLWQRYIDNSLIHEWVEPTLDGERRFAEALASIRMPDGSLERTLVKYSYQPRYPEEHPEGWREMERCLQEARELCRARGIDLMVTFVPLPIRVHSQDLVFNLTARKEDFLPPEGVESPTDFGSRMRELCRELELPYLDLYPVLRESAKTRRDLFVPKDEHFDTAGHELVAHEIGAWLESSPERMLRLRPAGQASLD